MESIHNLPLFIEPQPEGGYTVTCPLILELITEANTLDEVIPNISDAVAALVEAYEDLGQPIPAVLQSLASHLTRNDTAYLLKSETMRQRLLEAMERKDGIPFEVVLEELGI